MPQSGETSVVDLRAVAAADAAIGEHLSGAAVRCHLAGRTWPTFSSAERALALAHFSADPRPEPATHPAGPEGQSKAETVRTWLAAYAQAAQTGL